MRLQLSKLVKSTLAGLAIVAAPTSLFADSIDPATFSASLGLGETVTINKTVTISAGAPTTALIDVMFLMDTTGSMGGVIAAAKTAAIGITNNLAGFGSLASGTAYFNDSPAPVAQWTAITSALSTTVANTIAGINGYTVGVPSNGGSAPEQGFLGIQKTTLNTTWRPSSNRFIVMFGDNSDSQPALAAAAAAALAGSNVTLIGVSYGANFANTYTGIATGSGGSMNPGSTNAATLTNLITSAVTSSFATYNKVCLDASGAPAGVTVTTTGCHVGTYDRSIQRTFNFTVSFTGDAVGDYSFPINALVDGGVVAVESDHIVVADVPEPGMLSLLGLGLLGMGIRRRLFAA